MSGKEVLNIELNDKNNISDNRNHLLKEDILISKHIDVSYSNVVNGQQANVILFIFFISIK